MEQVIRTPSIVLYYSTTTCRDRDRVLGIALALLHTIPCARMDVVDENSSKVLFDCFNTKILLIASSFYFAGSVCR